MLNRFAPAITVPVSDMNLSRAFYEGVLGFSGAREVRSGTLYDVAGSDVLLYESPTAGTNQATLMGFEVDDTSFDREVSSLRQAGIDFITFEYEGANWEDGVAVMDGTKSVWFADPDGNILAASSGIIAD